MEKNFLKWHKTFRLNPPYETSEFYLMLNKDDYYHGLLIYCKENKNRVNQMTIPAFELVPVHFFDFSEGAIFMKLDNWLKVNVLDGTINVVETRFIKF
jgi:hypothetical protein